METIKIETPYNKENFIRLSNILLEIHWKKFRKQLNGIAIASITFLVLGFLVRTQSEPFNPFLLFGIVFSIISIFWFLTLLLSKSSLSRKIKITAQRYDEIKMDCTYEFSDDSVKYWDKEKHFDFKWTVFTDYSVYKNYLIIKLNTALTNPFIFEKTDSDFTDYNRILELVKTKIEYKEIK